MTALSSPRNAISAAGARPVSASKQRGDRRGWLYSAPAVVTMGVLLFGPLLAVMLFSLTDWQLGQEQFSFIGARNFQELFADTVFWKSLRNTFLYVLLVVPGTVILGLIVAVLLESSNELKGLYRTAHFIPVMAATSAMAIVWGTMLHPTIGLFNHILYGLGYSGVSWLRDEHTALLALVLIGIWQGFGYAMVLFIAGLKAIPQNLYDAAEIDGADSVMDRMRLVVLPMIGPVLMFVMVVTAVRAFSVFDTVRVLTAGGPNYSTDVLLYRLNTESFDYLRTGYGAALTVVFLGIVIAITLLQAKIMDRRVHYS
ncbi:MAG: sugar ABC transporter permease [Hyphomicrobium sp.]|nr:sugar ABC transporter permease [Hyphomicrobium sp.]